MAESEFFNTILQNSNAEFKDRGSRFIAYAFPLASVADFKPLIDKVKAEHPKASHHCFAYRIGSDKNIFRSSDAGEPSGTAGKPILGQIDSRELTNILIVVVRYFGGSLLGVPGLINAYKTAASLALQVTPIIKQPIIEEYRLSFDYTRMNEIMMVIRQMNINILQKDISMFSSMTLGIPRAKVQEAIYRFEALGNIEIRKNGNAD